MASRVAWPASGGAEADAARQGWRQLLAQSNKEMLLELASHVTAGDGSGSRNLEDIALSVADRILSQPSAMRLLEVDAQSPANAHQSEADTSFESPQLSDIKAVQWSIWSDGLDDAKGHDITDCKAEVAGQSETVSKKLGDDTEQSSFPQDKEFGLSQGFSRQLSSDSDDGHRGRRGSIMHSGLELRTTTQPHTWMRWHGKPKTVLLVAKQHDQDVTRRLRDIASWIDSQGCGIILEPELLREVRGDTPLELSRARSFSSSSDRHLKLCWCAGDCSCPRMPPPVSSGSSATTKWGWGGEEGLPPGFASRCRTWSPGHDKLQESVDLIICVGGDGTLCWAAGLFAGAMPPVIAFAGGSLGFLTPFSITDWMATLMPILGSNCAEIQPVQLACRMRFQMRVVRASEAEGEAPPPIPVQALNEVLVHRGSSGNLVKLEVWVNKTRVTMVQGDGLILATPTGSTAYSLAAGGSMMHPSVPGIILTPVCPHSLSFRPVVLPDSAVVKVRVPMSARSSKVMVAVDGKDRIELHRGDSVEVSVSPFPLPTLCKSSVTDDWFLSVNEALQWNLRLEQKALNKF